MEDYVSEKDDAASADSIQDDESQLPGDEDPALGPDDDPDPGGDDSEHVPSDGEDPSGGSADEGLPPQADLAPEWQSVLSLNVDGDIPAEAGLHGCPHAADIRSRIANNLGHDPQCSITIRRHLPTQGYQFSCLDRPSRSFTWGDPSRQSYCGDNEEDAIEKGIVWLCNEIRGIHPTLVYYFSFRVGHWGDCQTPHDVCHLSCGYWL